jgi:hypothetical protein
LPLGATLAAATEGLPEVVMAATLAVVTAAPPELHTEAASPEVVSRAEADMVVGGIKRPIGWTDGNGTGKGSSRKPAPPRP